MTPTAGDGGTTETEEHLRKVFQSLPPDRIQPYLAHCEGNPYKALTLYVWNTKASGAMYETLGHFEVFLRNAIDNALASRHAYLNRPTDWLANHHGELSARAADLITEAELNVLTHGGTPSRGATIAELNFGFWFRLLDARYERYWGSAIMRAFPSLKRAHGTNNDMENLRNLVEPLYKLRNRVAHYEPVWKIQLANREADALSCIDAANEEMAKWTASLSRVAMVLASHPAPPR